MEQIAPAMPRREAEKRVGADNQRKGTRAVLLSQFLERDHRIARAFAPDLAGVDLESRSARNSELDHGDAMCGRGDRRASMRRVASRHQAHGGQRQRGTEVARELYMPAVNRVERAAQNSECAIRHGGRAAALKSASRVLAGRPLPEQW